MFGRAAVVVLNGPFRTIKLGRQYDPVNEFVQPLIEDNSFSGPFATPGDIDIYDNDLPVSNAIKYTSPLMSGVQAEGLYA